MIDNNKSKPNLSLISVSDLFGGNEQEVSSSINHLVNITKSVFHQNINVLQISINKAIINSYNIFTHKIAEKKPDVIGFSCYCWNIEFILNFSEDIKLLLPETIIVLGGPEVSFSSKEILQKHPHIDIIVRGEGENTFIELINCLFFDKIDISQVTGITYRKGDSILRNKDRELISNLDTIPSVIHNSEIDYSITNGEISYETVRGCIYECGYCLYTKGVKGIRKLSLERVKEELTVLCKNPAIEVIWFTDPTFNADEKRAIQIIDFVLEANPNQKVAFELRAELLSENFLIKLSQLQIEDIAIGLQTLNPETLSILKRPFKFDLFDKKLRQLFAYINGKQTTVFIDLIFGLPNDTIIDYKNSIDYALSFNAFVYYQPLRVFKGTYIDSIKDNFGIVCSEFSPYNVLKTATFTEKDIVNAYSINAALDFYQSKLLNIKEFFNSLAEIKNQNISDVLLEFGNYLWSNSKFHFFRLSNSTPDDLPQFWRSVALNNFIVDNKLDSVCNLFSVEVEKVEHIKSGFYNAAI